jgi:hypothetical protein
MLPKILDAVGVCAAVRGDLPFLNDLIYAPRSLLGDVGPLPGI